MWINHLSSVGKSPKTVHDYFSFVKLYLHYRGIRLTAEDVRQSIDFPARINEEKSPLVPETIRDILNTASYGKRGLYLALLSSGMRMGEAVQLRKKDVFMGFGRILIRMPARITKTKQGRTTYVSREAGKFIMSKLRKISDDGGGDDGLVFGTNADPGMALAAEEKAFRDSQKDWVYGKIRFRQAEDIPSFFPRILFHKGRPRA